MLPGRKYTPESVVGILVRRRWMILMPLALGLAAMPKAAGFVPERYRSETLIMVVPQRVPDSYVRSTVTAKVEDRLPAITDQILSRSRLERIIVDLDLHRDERERGIMEDVVQRMRADIGVSLDGQSKESFRVSYISEDPRTAQRVTERLASLYIEQNLRDRETLAESTNQFLETQLEDAKRRLVEHEQKLEEYRRRYAGQLPSQLTSNLQAIQNAQLQLQSVNESMNRARERRLLIERQLADVEILAQQGITPAGAPGSDAAPATAAERLENARKNLDLLRLRFTADHPDVRSLERTIGELEVKAAEEAKRPPEPERPITPAELIRQKRIRDLQAELDVIDRQLASARAEEQKLKAAMVSYQANVDAVPSRESELVELTRDYSTLQAAYANLLTKREESKIAANLERRQIGEQFRILDAASLPSRPFNLRERLMAVAAPAAAGLLLGVLLAAFLEYRDSSFNREQDVLAALTLPVLAMVPAMASERELRVQRWRGRAIDAAAVLVLIGSIAVVVLWRLQP